MIRRPLAVLAAVLIATAATAACSGAAPSPKPTSSPSASTRDPALEAAITALPASIRSSGQLTFGTSQVGPPGVYPNGRGDLIGWEIELAQLIATELGLEAEFTDGPFGELIGAVAGGKTESAVASIFITPERRKQAAWVAYYRGGTLWARSVSASITPDTACGATVATITDSYQELTDLPERSAACVARRLKPITIMGMGSMGEASEAVRNGKADALVGDSPTVLDSIALSRAQLVATGDIYDLYDYGLPVASSNMALASAIQQALVSLKASGRYDRLLGKWGVETGGLDSFPVDAA